MIDFLKFLLYKKSSLPVSVVFLGSFLFYSFFNFFILDQWSLFIPKKEKCLSNLLFINPEPGCELFADKVERMSSLQKDLEIQVNGYIDTKRVNRISVFTRDLNSQRFAGVNEGEIFYMASLLKVPLAISYFRLSEITPDLLSQQVTFTNVANQYYSQTIQPSQKLILGNVYEVKDLIYHALVYSDNSAAEMLMQNFVSEEYLQKILTSIGLQVRKNGQDEDLVTAKSYAGVFRILYNSSFLQRGSSNEILKMLSESDFKNGAVALLPKDLIVSHKFGERTGLTLDNKVAYRQLHDCGIVYAKDGKEPYTFCIMTEGQDFKDLESVIQEISLTIYKGIVE